MPEYTTKSEPVDKKPYIVYTDEKGILYSGDPDSDIPGGGSDGDFTTAKATIQNGGQAPIFLSCAQDSELMTASMPLIMPSAEPVEYTAILYKGKAVLGIQGGTVATRGSIEDAEQGSCIITGVYTVTVS